MGELVRYLRARLSGGETGGLLARVMESPKFIDAEFMQMNLGDYVCIGQGLAAVWKVRFAG